MKKAYFRGLTVSSVFFEYLLGLKIRTPDKDFVKSFLMEREKEANRL